MPRIIAGSARGTKLAAPAGEATRPTGDRVKEALFSILSPRLPACRFLDLYAGTGQIGLEAVSRGAAAAVLVERDMASLAAIRTNAARTHLAHKTEVLAADVDAAVRQLLGSGRSFDLVFLDPPYRTALADLSRLAPGLARLLDQAGLLILEHDSSEQPPAFVTNLQLSRSCQYGAAMLSFYKVDQSDMIEK